MRPGADRTPGRMLPALARTGAREKLRSTPEEKERNMYAQAIRTSTTSHVIRALGEEPGFRGLDETPSGALVALWESESTARRPMPDFGGRLLNLYRASGRPA
jgi:hypothetical protein